MRLSLLCLIAGMGATLLKKKECQTHLIGLLNPIFQTDIEFRQALKCQSEHPGISPFLEMLHITGHCVFVESSV